MPKNSVGDVGATGHVGREPPIGAAAAKAGGGGMDMS